MKKIVQLLRSRTVAALFIVFGLMLTLFFGLRAAHAFRRMPPFPPHPPQPYEEEDGIRSWMNINYISKVYHVPPEYLVRYLGLPPLLTEGQKSLDDLNEELGLGTGANGKLLIVERLEWAILEFQAHPDFRQNHLVAPTMSIHFVAVEANIPQAYFFEHIGISLTGNEYKTIDTLSQEFSYPGGWEALTNQIQSLLNAYSGE